MKKSAQTRSEDELICAVVNRFDRLRLQQVMAVAAYQSIVWEIWV